jgi:hypothetical protein
MYLLERKKIMKTLLLKIFVFAFATLLFVAPLQKPLLAQTSIPGDSLLVLDKDQPASGTEQFVSHSTGLAAVPFLIDSVYNYYSHCFSPASYTGSITSTNPASYTKLYTSAFGKPHITTVVQGTNDQINYFAVDTISAVGDSAQTASSGVCYFGQRYGLTKYVYYRLEFIGATGNSSVAYIKNINIVFTKQMHY